MPGTVQLGTPGTVTLILASGGTVQWGVPGMYSGFETDQRRVRHDGQGNFYAVKALTIEPGTCKECGLF